MTHQSVRKSIQNDPERTIAAVILVSISRLSTVKAQLIDRESPVAIRSYITDLNRNGVEERESKREESGYRDQRRRKVVCVI